MNRADDLGYLDKFKDQLISILSDVSELAQCLIPLDEKDKRYMKEGMDSLDKYINGLKDAKTPAQLNQYIDIEQYLETKAAVEKEINENISDVKFREHISTMWKMVE